MLSCGLMTSFGLYIPGVRNVKVPNCLIEKLSEIDSLPHVRKLSEMPAPNEWGVSQREVNNERKKIGCEGGGGTLPEGE